MTGSVPTTLATDDTQFGAVGAAADVDGNIHGQLRYIGESVDGLETTASSIQTAVELIDDVVATISSTVVNRVALFDDNDSQIGTSTNPLHVTTETGESNLPQAYGTLASGTDAYQTVATASADRHHVMIDLPTGSYGAIISLDSGTTDHIVVSPGTSKVLDNVLISSGATVQAKNLSAGNNHSAIYITIW